MLRRSIIPAVDGSAVVTMLPASAQTAKTYRIGWLSHNPLTGSPQVLQVFHQDMHERGWVKRRSYGIENLYSDGNAEREPVIDTE